MTRRDFLTKAVLAGGALALPLVMSTPAAQASQPAEGVAVAGSALSALQPCRCIPGVDDEMCWGHWDALAHLSELAGKEVRTWDELVRAVDELTRVGGGDGERLARSMSSRIGKLGARISDPLPPDLRERGRECRARRYPDKADDEI